MRCLPLVFVFFFGLITTAGAALVERDLYVTGDGLLSYDVANQREWLDLTETFGWDPSTLEVALSPSGSLRGFKLATLADLEGLASSAGVSWISPWQYPGVSGNEANLLIQLVGAFPTDRRDESSEIPTNIPQGIDYDDIVLIPVGPFGPLEGAVGFIADDEGLVSGMSVLVVGSGELVPGQINVPISFRPWGGIFAHQFVLESIAGPYWLYRTVPEPSCLVLLGIVASLSLTRVCR